VRRRLPLLLIFGISTGLILLACAQAGLGSARQREAPSEPRTQVSGVQASSQRLGLEVLSVSPHDRSAFTQGLLLSGGLLYESTGLVGESSLREVDPATGQVFRRVDVPPPIFAEGLAVVDNRLIQITWQNEVAFVYDLASFERIGEFRYPGEGWGICYDGQRLVMSDGSSQLFFRDPQTFDLLGQVSVLRDGQPVARLNELECVGDQVYANVWQTDEIVDIESDNGRVIATIDASGLLSAEEMRTRSPDDVLNGIAYDAESDSFLITGKRWPRLYQVRFVPTAG
jgi:glutaminyl-peptide cyclotransferase